MSGFGDYFLGQPEYDWSQFQAAVMTPHFLFYWGHLYMVGGQF